MVENKLTRLSVEYNLTEHCNLTCYACDHASPLLPKKFASIEEFTRDFEALARVFHSKQLRIVGGEPLLHPQLIEFLVEARRIKIADAIVLITNGVLLHEAPGELWKRIDQLWISAYPGVKRKLDDEECARICKTHNVHLQIWHANKFNRTLINNRVDDPDLVKAIFRECKLAGEVSCHTVHEGRFYKCSIAPFMGPRLAMRGIAFNNRNVDGVLLHDNHNLYEDVDRCLNGPTPLAACSYCLGTSGPLVDHHQLNRNGRQRWLEEDNRPDIEQLRTSLLELKGDK
jgi:MoaA/NifB/PqqE/SkfB family radical SAM enzyme